MKKTILFVAVSFFSIGAFMLLNAQDAASDAPETALSEEATAEDVSETKEEKKLIGIRTDAIVAQKLEKDGDEVTVAPVASIFAESGQYFVLAKGAESDIDFQQREVKLGKTNGAVVEITEGLFPGDEVITVATNQLKFPAFDDEFAAGACGPNGCPVDAKGNKGNCSIDGECEFTFEAEELFSTEEDVIYGSGPVYGYGPGGFCPPY